MIGICTTCGGMFETTTEDACAPDCQCPECYRAARAPLTAQIAAGMADPEGEWDRLNTCDRFE